MILADKPRLPSSLYRAEQVRAMDRFAIDTLGIAGSELMNRAGQAAFQALREYWPSARTVSVLCGAGNNGGDGYVLARLAAQAGMDVRVYPVAPVNGLRGDAASAFEAYKLAGGEVLNFIPAEFEGAEVLVDGLLGTGLDREVAGLYLDVIRATRRFRGGMLALDIPSGLHADTGAVLGEAVRADVTVSFIGLKQGLFTGEGPDHCGLVMFDDLSTPPTVQQSQSPSARLLPPGVPVLRARSRGAHKGHFGHVLVIGGEQGYSGAVRLAAEAAARVGAGLVSVATHPAHAPLLNLTRPELMCRGVAGAEDVSDLLAKAKVIAIGPGLGQTPWSRQLFDTALASGLPLVLDADALNLLARNPLQREDWVLTPHPGEAGRLLQIDNRQVQADRFTAVHDLRRRYGGTVVLKGAGSLVLGESGLPAVCTLGNPGMASGGMGDVLTGVIAGFVGQGWPCEQAAEMGVLFHAAAADRAADEAGERGLLAGDLMPHLRALVNA